MDNPQNTQSCAICGRIDDPHKEPKCQRCRQARTTPNSLKEWAKSCTEDNDRSMTAECLRAVKEYVRVHG